MLLAFTYGVIFGILLILLIFYIFLSNPFEKSANKRTFVEQFPPLRLPPELKKFLGSCEDDSHSKWETCFCLSLLFHFLFQEHKDTRFFRRWLYERLQLELSDLTTRSAAGRLIQDVRIRDLSVGSHFPVIKKIRIENYEMFEEDGFNVIFLYVDYTGGFQTSIDLAMVLRRFAQMSIKVTRLSGKVRLTMTRKPFTHWTISFVEMPILDMKIETHWQGKQLKHVIPFITQQFRRIIQRKHIWPSYKIRYRPFFTNPILIPSHPTDSYNHIKIMGVLEVTILQCTRLNTSLSPSENAQVHCTVSLGHQPLHYSSWNSLFSNLNILQGDIVLAINNVPIRNERQLGKLLCGTLGDLNVLVQRTDINNEGNNSKDRYLNISIFAEFDIESGHTDSRNDKKIKLLVGLENIHLLFFISIQTSIYVPQILDDCRLTLSNCHREIYSLKPPENPTSKPISPLIEEASRHAGFDSRICYGDILIGFRYFPSGLPKETEILLLININEKFIFLSHFSFLSRTIFFFSEATICGVCNGKIWFKNASRCSRCLLVCHNKCTVKNFKLLICDPCDHFEDDTFEVIIFHFLICLTDGFSEFSGDSSFLDIFLLRRIANKVTEKWNNTWNKMARRKISDSHKMELSEVEIKSSVNADFYICSILLKNVIPDVLVDLDVPSCLSNMMFQPGDAYDENLIQEAKNIGKSLFLDLNWPERKIKINSQIDRIQKIIDKTTAERLKLITNLKSPPQKRDEFNIIDDRLQALAMLMLHYCAALQVANHNL
ncbi:unnamed protein product [Dracunculus medinensis]|uniref:PDZ domain-containing protein 8 n=1 Tax=Dracunculus medinensis TaxID=318479 RepID=A0A0N4U3G6_DRAME|nr:unnamed protein product [Dracunculus medinensis]